MVQYIYKTNQLTADKGESQVLAYNVWWKESVKQVSESMSQSVTPGQRPKHHVLWDTMSWGWKLASLIINSGVSYLGRNDNDKTLQWEKQTSKQNEKCATVPHQ